MSWPGMGQPSDTWLMSEISSRPEGRAEARLRPEGRPTTYLWLMRVTRRRRVANCALKSEVISLSELGQEAEGGLLAALADFSGGSDAAWAAGFAGAASQQLSGLLDHLVAQPVQRLA